MAFQEKNPSRPSDESFNVGLRMIVYFVKDTVGRDPLFQWRDAGEWKRYTKFSWRYPKSQIRLVTNEMMSLQLKLSDGILQVKQASLPDLVKYMFFYLQ